MKRTIVIAMLTALMVFADTSKAAEAAKDKSTPESKHEGKQKQMPFRGKVSAVDKTKKTVTMEGKEKGRTFQITSATKITKEGKPALLDDVIVGQTIGGLAKENAGKWEIVTLSVGANAKKGKDGENKGENK